MVPNIRREREGILFNYLWSPEAMHIFIQGCVTRPFLVETFKTHSYKRMMPRNPTLFSVCTSSFFLLAFLFYFKPCIFSLYLVLQFPDTTKNHAFFYFSKYPKFNLKKWWEKKCFCFLMCNFQCCNFKFHVQGPCAASIVD